MRTRPRTALPVLVLALAATAPATAAAQSTGGAEVGAAKPGSDSASDGAVTISSRPAALLHRRKTFKGAIPASQAGRTVTVERYDALSGQWSAITRATARDDGSFKARWKPDRTGPARVRARVEAPSAAAAQAAPELSILVYRAARATWYGPGLYGNRTACGQKLTRRLVGVAHRGLRCGTRVQILYRGRTITVPVVDRGPFANGAKWDLTAAAAEQVGLRSTQTIGTLRASKAR